MAVARVTARRRATILQDFAGEPLIEGAPLPILSLVSQVLRLIFHDLPAASRAPIPAISMLAPRRREADFAYARRSRAY